MIDALYQCAVFCAFLFGGMYICYRRVRKPGDKFFMRDCSSQAVTATDNN